MSWWWLLFGPLLVWMGIEIVKDLIAYWRTLKYKAQGFHHRYVFLMGNISLRFPDKSVFPQIMNNWKKSLSRAGSKPGLVVNSFPRGRAMIYLTDPTLVHEFLLKDHSVCRRHDFLEEDTHYNESFPFKFGPQAEQARERFVNLFRRDKMEGMVEVLRKDIRNHMLSLQKRSSEGNSTTATSFTSDWKEITRECMFKITNSIFFGSSENPVRVKSQDNKIYGDAVLQYLEGPYRDTLNSQLNTMLYRLPEKLKLLKSANQAAQTRSELVSVLRTEYLRRRNDPAHVPSWNFVDLKIAATTGTDPATVETAVEQIFEEICLYVIAGLNTTRKSVNGTVYQMALHPEFTEKLYSEMCQFDLGKGSKTPITLELLDSMNYLDMFFKESQRYVQPFSQSFDRMVLEDFSLGKYRFHKGDLIVIPFTYHFFVDAYWKDPLQFNPERFSQGLPKTVPPMAFIPFGAGKRMCTGRVIAETVVKIFIIEVLQKYTLSLPEGKSAAPYIIENRRPIRQNYTIVCTHRL